MKASKLLINLEQRKISFRNLYDEEDPQGKLQALPHDYRRSMQSEDNSKHCISPKTRHLTQMHIWDDPEKPNPVVLRKEHSFNRREMDSTTSDGCSRAATAAHLAQIPGETFADGAETVQKQSAVSVAFTVHLPSR